MEVAGFFIYYKQTGIITLSQKNKIRAFINLKASI